MNVSKLPIPSKLVPRLRALQVLPNLQNPSGSELEPRIIQEAGPRGNRSRERNVPTTDSGSERAGDVA